jgi:hypothetical protein
MPLLHQHNKMNTTNMYIPHSDIKNIPTSTIPAPAGKKKMVYKRSSA